MSSVTDEKKYHDGVMEDEKSETTSQKVDVLAGQLKVTWSSAEILLNESSKKNLKERAHMLSQQIKECVELLINLSNIEKYEYFSCEFCQQSNVFHKVYSWTGQHRECLKQMASEQLYYFDSIVSRASIELLKCQEVIIPLTLLLLSLKPTDKRKIPPDIESFYVNILHHLALRISNIEFMNLLANDLFTIEGFRIPKFTFFELLILYTHNIGAVGDRARSGILSCIDVSNYHSDFQKYISQDSACVIIAGGLSARYSSLPTTLEISSEEWHGITRQDLDHVKELQEFLMTLNFCCQVSKIGNEEIKARLSLLIHDGFLKSVLAPALNQVSTDAQIAVMAYLDLFLRSITDDRVMEVFLRVLLTEAYDNKPLINLLIYHINSDSVQLSMVAMQLFKTLLELNCEDVIFHLIFRYLLPCHHILPNQKRTIKELDFYCKNATMFLYLTPQCCLETNQSEEKLIDEYNNSPSSQRSHKSEGNPFQGEHVFVDRKVSNVSTASANSKTSSGSTHSELKLQEIVGFQTYLHDAKHVISECKKDCQCWSAVYDGMDVITENRRMTSFRSSIISPRFSLQRELSGDAADGLAFARSLSNASSDSDVTPGVFDLSIPSQYTTECLGPFLNAIFDQLENMMENNLYANLLLTSLVTRLACYPQPLLRSFLLNTNLVIRPGVRSLSQILSQVSSNAGAFITQLDDYKLLISKARQNLLRREQQQFKRLSQDCTSTSELNVDEKDDEVNRSININLLAGTGTFQSPKKDTRDSGQGTDDLVNLSPFLMGDTIGVNTSRNKDVSKRTAQSFTPHGGKLHPAIPKQPRHVKIPSKKDLQDMRKKNPTAIKNAVYCVIVLEEFMKELAAVSIEQTLL